MIQGLADVCELCFYLAKATLQPPQDIVELCLQNLLFYMSCVWFYMFLCQSGSLYFIILFTLVCLSLLISCAGSVVSDHHIYCVVFEGPKPFNAVKMEKLKMCENTVNIFFIFDIFPTILCWWPDVLFLLFTTVRWLQYDTERNSNTVQSGMCMQF